MGTPSKRFLKSSLELSASSQHDGVTKAPVATCRDLSEKVMGGGSSTSTATSSLKGWLVGDSILRASVSSTRASSSPSDSQDFSLSRCYCLMIFFPFFFFPSVTYYYFFDSYFLSAIFFHCTAWWPSYTYMYTFFFLILSCSIISD